MNRNWKRIILLWACVFFIDKSFSETYGEKLIALGVDPKQIGQLIAHHQHPSVKDVDYLVSWLREKRVPWNKIAHVLPVYLDLLGTHIEENIKKKIEPKIDWLKKFNVTEEGIIRILSTHPSFFHYELEEDSTFGDKLDWLRSLGASETRLASILSRGPQIASYSLEKKLKPVWNVLHEKFGLTLIDIEKSPMLLGVELERIKSIVEWAEVRGIALNSLPIEKRKQIVLSGRTVGMDINLTALTAWANEDFRFFREVTSEEILSVLGTSGEVYRLMVTKTDKMRARHWQMCVDALESGLESAIQR